MQRKCTIRLFSCPVRRKDLPPDFLHKWNQKCEQESTCVIVLLLGAIIHLCKSYSQECNKILVNVVTNDKDGSLFSEFHSLGFIVRSAAGYNCIIYSNG